MTRLGPGRDRSTEQLGQIAMAQEAWLRDQYSAVATSRKDSFTTSSARPIQALYTPADLGPDFSYLEELGFPGQAPYTRGERAGGYREKLWTSEFYAGFGSAKDANARYRYLMEMGATGGVSIALDLPTQLGMDSDHPAAKNEIGKVGVALCSVDDVVDLFQGIDLAAAGKVFTTANCIGPIAFAWFRILADRRGVDPGSFSVTIQNDPLKEYVARGTQFLPVAASVRLACDVVEHCVREGLPWLPISVSGSHMKQAGGTCAQEAAFTLANAIAYADHLRDRGLEVSTFAPVMELHFCTDMDFFEEIAKYRVVRRVWTETLRERYGVEGVQPHIHAATSGLPLTAQQPRNNIVRITLQALAQILGGVHQTRTASYDEGLAIPTEDAVKLSIRTNQIIAHETGIADTIDPLGGSYYLEAITRAMHQEVRETLNQVDALGGAIRAVESGWFAQQLAEGAYRQQLDLEAGRSLVIGVNAFADEGREALKTFKVDSAAADRQLRSLAAHRAARDETKLAEALARLQQDLSIGTNSIPATIQAVQAGATVGEISDLWREVFGEFAAQARWLA